MAAELKDGQIVGIVKKQNHFTISKQMTVTPSKIDTKHGLFFSVRTGDPIYRRIVSNLGKRGVQFVLPGFDGILYPEEQQQAEGVVETEISKRPRGILQVLRSRFGK